MDRLIVCGLLLLLASGCVQGTATVVAEGQYLLNLSIDYAHRIHTKRQTVEEQCWQSVQRDLRKLTMEGDEEGYRRLLIQVYPQPVTLAIIREARNDPASILSKPPGCPDPDEEPGILKEDETEFLS